MKYIQLYAIVAALFLILLGLYAIAQYRAPLFREAPHCVPQEIDADDPLVDGACDWARAYDSPACVAASAAALRRLGSQIHEVTASCVLRDTGDRGGNHMLCAVLPPPAANPPCCTWLSVGVAHDYSFDAQLHDLYPACTGHLLDPSVSHAARLDDRLFFYPIGLQTRLPHPQIWVMASLPSLFRLLVGDRARLSVLKLDCEGCEYAVAEHVAAEHPRLFARVDQLAIEVHLARRWLRDERDAFHLGMLFEMLHREGLALQHVVRDACGVADEASGCADTPLFCAPRAMCHNYLFARVPL